MKKTYQKATSLIFAFAMAFTSLSPYVSDSVNAASEFYFVGQDSNVTKDIKIGSTDTGADYTRIHLGSGGSAGYGANKYINIIEANLDKNPNLTFEVINHGDYIKNAVQLDDQLKNYSEDDKKVIAAVNGDWMSWANSVGASVSNNYRVTFSPLILDEEIWCSQMTPKEMAADYYTFGVTTENKVIIGKPTVTLKVKNVDKKKTIATDGLNRAPANNSLVVYNNRLNVANYVSSDAYEIVINTSTSNKFYHDEKVIGTVSKIYPAGTTSRNDLTNDMIILTARGSEISILKDNFSVGDEVEITAKIGCTTDGRDWRKCEEAIGGQCLVMKDGKINNSLAGGTMGDYPTSIIGYKEDGTVMLTMVTADKNGVYQGLDFATEIAKFCDEVGYDTCFLFDGGGSTTMLTLENNSLQVRSCHADGDLRSVWNSLALVYDPTPDTVATAEPTTAPTATPKPTTAPTVAPTKAPTAKPTVAPTKAPTKAPTAKPTVAPTKAPTTQPTADVTSAPIVSDTPTSNVTEAPTSIVTEAPTSNVTEAPTSEATDTPTTTEGPIATPDNDSTEAPTANTDETSSDNDSTNNGGGMSTGLIVTIVVCSIVVIGCGAFFAIYVIKNNKKNK